MADVAVITILDNLSNPFPRNVLSKHIDFYGQYALFTIYKDVDIKINKMMPEYL